MSDLSYDPTSSVSLKADIGEHVKVGVLSSIGAFAKIGDRTKIGDHVLVGVGVHLGEQCQVQDGCILSGILRAGNKVNFFPGVTTFGNVEIADNVRIGVGATIVGSGPGDVPLKIKQDVDSGETVTE